MSEKTYKYTEEGQQVVVVSEIRPNVWEVYMAFSEYFDEDEKEMDEEESEVFYHDESTLYHGKLYDSPPLPVYHAKVNELNERIKELKAEESAMINKISALRNAEMEFENPKSFISGLGNLKRLITELPTHFMLVGTKSDLPKIIPFKDVDVVQDKVATIRIKPERNWGSCSQIFWAVRLNWRNDNVEAIPCFSIEEAKEHYRKRLVEASKWNDLGYNYLVWRNAMKTIGIEPSAAATNKYNESVNKEAEQKRKELEASIERQKRELEKFQEPK